MTASTPNPIPPDDSAARWKCQPVNAPQARINRTWNSHRRRTISRMDPDRKMRSKSSTAPGAVTMISFDPNPSTRLTIARAYHGTVRQLTCHHRPVAVAVGAASFGSA